MRFRRYYVPGAIVFITQVVEGRLPAFEDPARVELLRATLRAVKQIHPFEMVGYVFLPDHFHLLIRPLTGTTYSDVMHSLKPNFTKAVKLDVGVQGNLKFWQKRFWEHTIRDETDLERHLDYIHYNPVKHCVARVPASWPHSSFGAWCQRGAYDLSWGSAELPAVRDRWWDRAE